MADSFGGFGWLALLTIVAVAYLLAEDFNTLRIDYTRWAFSAQMAMR